MRRSVRRGAAALLAVTVGACIPDDADRAGSVLADGTLAWLAPDTVRVESVTEGVWYHYLWSPRGPWAVHLVEVALDRCALTFDVARAGDRERGTGGHERVSAMVARHSAPGRVIAAVNGDFFTPEGTPLGPEIARGQITSRATRSGFAWRDGAAPVLATISTRGDSLSGVAWGAEASGAVGAAAGEIDVIGGFPMLLDDAARVGDLGVAERPSFSASRHPRTAVGFDPDGRRLWLVVVDGRQGAYSSGMTLPELADLFGALDVADALNLDGGGSSAIVVEGTVRNRPSDDAGERAVVNALLLVEDDALCAVSSPGR